MSSGRYTYRGLLLVLVTLALLRASAWADWPPISADDLKMTDLAEMKGAPAVILLREEVADDPNNYHSVYMRIKILTEAGRRYADVEIPYWRRTFTIDSISGRTIHSDGSIVAFDGKVFDKMTFRARRGRPDEIRVHVKVFTLPDVQVGSIIDFRYSLRYEEEHVSPPEWIVQQDLFQKQATFKFVPYDGQLNLAHGRVGQGAAWSAFLPANGPQPQLHRVPLPSVNVVRRSSEYVDLSITNLAPVVDEPLMPPVGAIRYQVRFYYLIDPEPQVFWKEEGKFWSKDVEKFLDRKDGIEAAASKVVLPADSPEQKVRKIYAFVTGFENQSYRPKRTELEEKAIGLKPNEGAEDVLRQHSGDHNDLNRLFVAIVRAAGISARMMWVASRDETFFQPDLLSTGQLDAEVAIVELGGKDV